MSDAELFKAVCDGVNHAKEICAEVVGVPAGAKVLELNQVLRAASCAGQELENRAINPAIKN